MALRQPESMDECVYFTRRTIDAGKAMVWVFKEKCPKCKKVLMTKPVDDKTGKVKIRAAEYVCSECGYKEGKESYEEKLTANIAYTCPKCKNVGEIQVPYKRKSFGGTKAIIFNCQKCNEKIPITKKMKAPKKKGEPDLDE